MTKTFYVTTAIPYVNAPPHIGFALELIQADVIARNERLLGKEVRFLTGADENAFKNVLAAQKADQPVQDFVDQNTKRFADLKKLLNLSNDDFIRTSDQTRHWQGAQKIWQACANAGDIYQKNYEGWYCVGCEEFKTEKELTNGLCPEHNEPPQKVSEQNYFFRLSKYQDQLLSLIRSDNLKIIPESRKNEVLSFIESGLEDFSISRSVERAHGWGIPVPNDPSQVIYVWFDALANYITALGYGTENEGLLNKFWPADVHVIGKGIIRFHAVYWPAMLMSAGIITPRSIFVHGYLTVEGQKISKSLGNVIDPYKLVAGYGTDAVRYYLLKSIPATGDGDFSFAHFNEVYTADLANGIGNLTNRILAVVEKSFEGKVPNVDPKVEFGLVKARNTAWQQYQKALKEYKFNEAIASVAEFISTCDKYVAEKKPWQDHNPEVIYDLLESLHQIAWLVYPIIPETAAEIGRRLGIDSLTTANPLLENSKVPLKPETKITSGPALFPRKDKE